MARFAVVLVTLVGFGQHVFAVTLNSILVPSHTLGGYRDLAMCHIPFNFGNTIAKVALLGHNVSLESYGNAMAVTRQGNDVAWEQLREVAQPNAEYWGPLNPDLSVISNETGCNMYYTPQLLWPRDLLQNYFGNKVVFGVWRNPYDRLSSFFRGSGSTFFPEFYKTCDINGAVNKMMDDYLAGGKYQYNCQTTTQTEYLNGMYGVSVSIDIQQFPESVNEVLKLHGYDDMLIYKADEITVGTSGCDNVWAGDLNAATKTKVKQVYADDFQFLCDNFKYCDFDAPSCLVRSKGMCPDKAFFWDDATSEYKRRV